MDAAAPVGPARIELRPPAECRKVFIVATGMKYEHFGIVKEWTEAVENRLSKVATKVDLRQSLVKDPAMKVRHGENGLVAQTACCVFSQSNFPHVVVDIVEKFLSSIDIFGAAIFCTKVVGRYEIKLAQSVNI